ncbi:MAG: hypothetical protein MJ211_13620 [Bacteroidales bacterium]|nr:hypothetical protein [Bacteroidales bacterium]
MKNFINSKNLILLTMLLGIYSCIDSQELNPPEMTLSYTDTENILFSWREPAIINVKITSEEDIESFSMFSKPNYWQKDTTFPPYTHYVDFNIPLSLGQGFVVEDSTIILTFKSYSNGLCNEQFRKLKYEFHYPELDSFDITLSADPKKECLLDIENQTAYRYTDYRNHFYDLILVNETRVLWRKFGLSLANPSAEYYLSEYYKELVPDFPYDEKESSVYFKNTTTGLIHDKTKSWLDLSPEMVDSEDGWIETFLGDDENFGSGLSNIQLQTLYKAKLHNGKKVMINVLDIHEIQSKYPTVDLRIFYQK